MNIVSKMKAFAAVNMTAIALIAGTVGVSVIATSTTYAAVPVCPDNLATGQVTLETGAACAKGSKTADNLAGTGGVFQTVVNILLFLVGAVAVIMLVIGGLRYVTSNGDQNAVTGAKNTIMYAIIGIVVAFLAYAAVGFVIQQLGTSTSTTP